MIDQSAFFISFGIGMFAVYMIVPRASLVCRSNYVHKTEVACE